MQHPGQPTGARRNLRFRWRWKRRSVARLLPAAAGLLLAAEAIASEHVTLRNGFDMVCDHHVVEGPRTRLYMDLASGDYVEVATAEIAADEQAAATPAVARMGAAVPVASAAVPEVLPAAELREILSGAGTKHDLDVDLLASVVHAESNSRVHARSRVGAEGLMQLMPGTADQLGVHDAYAPAENVGGGAAYLDSLLHRYHDNLALALAAYNAGPAAVDRWHGVPPYRETRAYVARIIHEFNQRYAARSAAALAMAAAPAGRH